MKRQLNELLCARYPLIFTDPNFAFSCGDGWFYLVDTLCQQLQNWTDVKAGPQCVAHQVKEKFGELCFYPSSAICSEQWAMIALVEALSIRICDQCGNPGQTFIHQYHHMTRCHSHTPAGAQVKAIDQ